MSLYYRQYATSFCDNFQRHMQIVIYYYMLYMEEPEDHSNQEGNNIVKDGKTDTAAWVQEAP